MTSSLLGPLGSLWLGLVVGCGASDAQGLREQTPDAPPAYVAGELIVKLLPGAGGFLDAALAAGRLPAETGLAWFDALNQRYGVSRITPLFAGSDDAGLEEIKRKFPERAKRAPPNAQPPRLQYVYILVLPPQTDILQAAADYASHPDVEYATPNYIATTQPSGVHLP